MSTQRTGMIDLHNHLVYGIDDGAVDIDESLDIARQFAAEGVTTVVATPHFDGDKPRRLAIEMLRKRVDELRGAIAANNIGIELYCGNEIYLTPDVPTLLEQGAIACLGPTRAILTEVSPMSEKMPLFLADTVFRLQLAGYQVVLAHPERYGFVQRDPSSLDTLVERGVALQLTAPALLGEYGSAIRRTAEKLLSRGQYQMAASDRHHPGADRSLMATHTRIAELAGDDQADLLLKENPARLLAGQALREARTLSEATTPSLFQRLLRRPG